MHPLFLDIFGQTLWKWVRFLNIPKTSQKHKTIGLPIVDDNIIWRIFGFLYAWQNSPPKMAGFRFDVTRSGPKVGHLVIPPLEDPNNCGPSMTWDVLQNGYRDVVYPTQDPHSQEIAYTFHIIWCRRAIIFWNTPRPIFLDQHGFHSPEI